MDGLQPAIRRVLLRGAMDGAGNVKQDLSGDMIEDL